MITYIDPERYNSTFLQWTGANAQIWTYSLSLRRLVIRLTLPDRDKDLFLVAGGCRHFTGFFDWNDCRLRVDALPDDSQILVDTGGLVELRFDGALSVVTATPTDFFSAFNVGPDAFL
jgi:hypothetical protein